MTEVEHSCRTCESYEPPSLKLLRMVPGTGGQCRYVVDLSELPACFQDRWGNVTMPLRQSMHPDGGGKCKCWRRSRVKGEANDVAEA